MADIQAFISNMSKSGGFARPSQYEVKINTPNVFTFVEQAIRDGANVDGQFRFQQEAYANSIENRKHLFAMSEVSKQLTLQCQTVTMPSHDLQTQNRAYASEPGREMVQTHGYAGTIDCTFLLSNDLREKHYFELWQSLAVDNYTHKANYYDDYVGSMEIYQLSNGLDSGLPFPTFIDKVFDVDMAEYGIRASEVYPATISGIEYSYESGNQIATMAVGFNYREWRNLGNTESKLRPYS